MISYLGGNDETVKAHEASIGKTIKNARIDDKDRLILSFDDGANLLAFDDGQSCCESRYMRTDDDLEDLVGQKFVSMELRDAPSEGDPDGYGEHEVQFLILNTDKGSITFANHNEHNGYYGGFGIVLRTDVDAVPRT